MHREALPVRRPPIVVVGIRSDGADDADAEAPAPEQPRRDESVSVAPYLVLIVDDHDDTRAAYAEHLRMEGFRTAEAENGAVAIRMARELQPDAIVLDYAMPMMDGVQASLFLKRDAATRHIPIIMLTAYYDLVRGRGHCDRYLDKPCDPRKVVTTLRSLLGSVGVA